MRQQNGEQGQGKRQPAQQHRGVAPEDGEKLDAVAQIEGGGPVEVELKRGSDGCGRKQCCKKQDGVEPVSLVYARQPKTQSLTAAGPGVKRIGRGRDIPGCHNCGACSSLL